MVFYITQLFIFSCLILILHLAKSIILLMQIYALLLKTFQGQHIAMRQAQLHCRAHKPNYYLVTTYLLHLSLYNLEIPDYYRSSNKPHDESCMLLSTMFPLPSILQTLTLLTHT